MLSRSTSPRSHTSALASPFAGSPLLPGGALPVSRDAGGAHAAPAAGTAGEPAYLDLPSGDACVQHAHCHLQGQVQALSWIHGCRRGGRRPRRRHCSGGPVERCARLGARVRNSAAVPHPAAAAQARAHAVWRQQRRQRAPARAAACGRARGGQQRWQRHAGRAGSRREAVQQCALRAGRGRAIARQRQPVRPRICGGEAAELVGCKPHPADMDLCGGLCCCSVSSPGRQGRTLMRMHTYGSDAPGRGGRRGSRWRRS